MMIPRIKLPQKVTRAIGKLTFKAAKAKPGACIVVGLIFAGGAVVMAAVDTWKGKDKLNSDIDQIKALKEPQEEVGEEERKNQLIVARKQFAVDIIKTYWKPVVLSGGSLILILHGKKLYKHQIAELGAMYTALLNSYRQYRQNVVNDLGAEKDQEYMYGLKKVETVDSETGEVGEQYILDEGLIPASTHAVWWNEGIWDDTTNGWLWKNRYFQSSKQFTEVFLHEIQNNCNDILTRKGFLYLNEVLYQLRLPYDKDGWKLGWVKGGFIDGTPCDDFVDFRVFPTKEYGDKYQLPVNKLWLDYRSGQKYLLLDFNCVNIEEVTKDIRTLSEYDNRSDVAYSRRFLSQF